MCMCVCVCVRDMRAAMKYNRIIFSRAISRCWRVAKTPADWPEVRKKREGFLADATRVTEIARGRGEPQVKKLNRHTRKSSGGLVRSARARARARRSDKNLIRCREISIAEGISYAQFMSPHRCSPTMFVSRAARAVVSRVAAIPPPSGTHVRRA